MAQQERPTLRTVAALTGFAVATVSRALANDPRIALETRNRVVEAAKEIGYSPDRAAQRLRTGRTNVIALLLNPHEEIIGYGSSLISGITKALRKTPYHLVVMPNFADHPPLHQIENILRNRLADGLIMSRTEPQDIRVRLLLERSFPFITHGRTELATPHAFVDYDNYAFAREAVHKLADGSVRRVAMIPAPKRFTFAQHLKIGFLSGCAEKAITGQLFEELSLDSSPEDIYSYLSKVIAKNDIPDGIVCPGETSALAVRAAYADAGISDRCKLVMKNTSQLSEFIRPRIDSIFEDLEEAGERMGKLLLRAISGESVEALTHIQPVQFRMPMGASNDQ